MEAGSDYQSLAMNKNNNQEEFFDTPSACYETLYTYVENILNESKTDQNVQ